MRPVQVSRQTATASFGYRAVLHMRQRRPVCAAGRSGACVPITTEPVKVDPPEPSFSSYVSNVAHKPVTITGTLAVSRTKVQDNAMPSLDRLLIGGALVLPPSSLAVLWRRGQRNRCDFLCCRLLDAVACASRERGSIVSLLVRQQRVVTSRAFFVTDPRIDRGDRRAFGRSSRVLPARTTRLQLIQPLCKRRDRLPGSIPPSSTISLPLGRRQAPTRQTGNW